MVLVVALILAALVAALLIARSERLARRLAAGERAALGASVDDPTFDPDALIEAARLHLEPIRGRRREADLPEIEERFGRHALDPLLYRVGWSQYCHRPLFLDLDRPRFHVVDLELTPERRVARATVRVAVRVRGGAPSAPAWANLGITFTRSARAVAYWVFARDGGWTLAHVEPGTNRAHRLGADPTGEHRLLDHMRDESLRELVEPPAAPEIPFEVATNLPYDPEDALGDLTLVDDRFAPAVIEAAVRRVVERWERSTDDGPDALAQVADPPAVRALLAGGRVIHGARVASVRATRLWALRVPPEVDVEVWVDAWAGPAGSVRGWRVKRAHWWRFAATTSRELPWRLVEAGSAPLPARARHHVSRR